MAVTKGTWLGLPDFGITEFFTGGTQPGTTPRSDGNVPADVQAQVKMGPGTTPVRNGQVAGLYTSNTSTGSNPIPDQNKTLNPTGKKSGGGQQQASGLTADILRSRFGINDPNVINNILGDSAQTQRYLNELNGGSGGGQSESEQINALYEPYLNELNNIAGGLNTRAMENLQNIEADYGSGEKNLMNEQSDLEKALQLQEQKLNQGAQSGYSDALRAYNNLRQQGMNRFGGGSSTGAAISDLIGQQFLRTTGQARQQVANAQQELGLEGQKVKTYIGNKKTELEKWKREASQMVRDTLASKLEEINLKRGEIESNKTAAKQDALKQAIADTRAIQQKDLEFKQGLATWALDTMQKTSGRSFTPQEIAQVYNDVIGQTYSGLNAYANAGGPASYNQIARATSKDQEDKLRAAGLI